MSKPSISANPQAQAQAQAQAPVPKAVKKIDPFYYTTWKFTKATNAKDNSENVDLTKAAADVSLVFGDKTPSYFDRMPRSTARAPVIKFATGKGGGARDNKELSYPCVPYTLDFDGDAALWKRGGRGGGTGTLSAFLSVNAAAEYMSNGNGYYAEDENDPKARRPRRSGPSILLGGNNAQTVGGAAPAAAAAPKVLSDSDVTALKAVDALKTAILGLRAAPAAAAATTATVTPTPTPAKDAAAPATAAASTPALKADAPAAQLVGIDVTLTRNADRTSFLSLTANGMTFEFANIDNAVIESEKRSAAKHGLVKAVPTSAATVAAELSAASAPAPAPAPAPASSK